MRTAVRTHEPVSPQVDALLQQRAGRLRELPLETNEESFAWIARFRIGDFMYAIPMLQLRAAVSLRLITPVPLASRNVVGIMSYHGRIITARSLSTLLGVRGWRNDPCVLLVVESSSGGLMALDCEEVPTPVSLPVASIEQARSRAAANSLVLEVTTEDLSQISLLQIDSLFDKSATEKQHAG